MTRVYKSTPAAGSGAPPGPRPPHQTQRAGIQVVTRRPERIGPTAAEMTDGVVPPLKLVDDSMLSQSGGHDSMLSNGAARPAPHLPATFDDDRCAACGGAGALLVTVGRVVLCDACVMLGVDAVRDELPRRRLRLAMERLAAGPVSLEMLATIEAMANPPPSQTKAVAMPIISGRTDGGGGG